MSSQLSVCMAASCVLLLHLLGFEDLCVDKVCCAKNHPGFRLLFMMSVGCGTNCTNGLHLSCRCPSASQPCRFGKQQHRWQWIQPERKRTATVRTAECLQSLVGPAPLLPTTCNLSLLLDLCNFSTSAAARELPPAHRDIFECALPKQRSCLRCTSPLVSSGLTTLYHGLVLVHPECLDRGKTPGGWAGIPGELQ